MITRPTDRWRREAEAGENPWAAELWPPDFTAAVEAALVAFEREAAGLGSAPDTDVWAAVERVVEALNDADDGHIETGEREDLCEYVDQVLTAAGVDVAALTARRGIDRAELTDDWRDW
ncbi:hypothetical protein [Actinoplanes sp. NPDC048796]|uniref:hypothetical protein n=1 Tax=unclassified Actinoplanes TaxID=2626549 RepID=UPI0033E33B8B